MIEIFYEVALPQDLSSVQIELFVKHLAAYLKIDQHLGFSISFITEEHMQALNKEFRGKDKPTDVLTFCLNEADEQDFPHFDYSQAGENRSLGDILISLSVVFQHAQQFNVSIEEELKRVIIHGILHLLGKNHTTNEANEPMLIEQEYILEELKGHSFRKK